MEEAINIFPKEKFLGGERYQRKDTDMRRFRPTAEELEKHKGNWKKMFERS